MKKRSTIEFNWLPAFGINDNMLAYVSNESYSRVWLHKFQITRSSGEKYAQIKIDFFHVRESVIQTDFHRDYRSISSAQIYHHFPLLHKRLQAFAHMSHAAPMEKGSMWNTLYFDLPLHGKNFTTRAMDVVANAVEIITNNNSCWVNNLKITETATEVFDAKDGWIPFETHLLRKNGYK